MEGHENCNGELKLYEHTSYQITIGNFTTKEHYSPEEITLNEKKKRTGGEGRKTDSALPPPPPLVPRGSLWSTSEFFEVYEIFFKILLVFFKVLFSL